jgi:hypothetical protein
MEAIKSIVQLPRKTANTAAVIQTGIIAIAGIEQELGRLNNLFSAASFILAAHDVESLAEMSRLHARLKSEVAEHIQRLKLNSVATIKPISKLQLMLDTRLEREILILRARVHTFTSKLFKKTSSKRHIL